MWNKEVIWSFMDDRELRRRIYAQLAKDYCCSPGEAADGKNQFHVYVPLEGRMEIIGTGPSIVVDGSHTAYSIRRLATSCKEIFGYGGVLVFGSVKGKNYQSMLDILVPSFGFMS